MVTLAGALSRISPVKVAVIGDFMLDTYTVGKARRISPEAPVVVVNVAREEHRAGGAGNVVLNLLSMGASVVAIGRTGDDAEGKLLRQIFSAEDVSTAGFFVQPDYKTPVKNRIIAENQQIVRVDHEQLLPLGEMVEQKVIEALPSLLEGVKVIAISDYDKGFLSRTLLAAIIDYAKSTNCVVIADPKGLDFTKYCGATIIKPNLSEVYAAANLPREAPLEHAAAKVLELTEAQVVMVTRSESGISLFYRGGQQADFPVRVHEVKDVTGAGDTVLAMLACALGSGLDLPEATSLCNVAASIAIERLGCARVSVSDLARKLLELDSGNKVFDSQHMFALQLALKDKKTIALDFEECKELNISTFQLITRLGKQEDSCLLAYLADADPSSPLVAALKELHAIDFILVGSYGFKALCQTLSIDEVHAAST